MSTEEMNQENVIALVKLGIDVKDIANIYITITKKGQNISKQEFIQNLTDILKFFQTRNKEINPENGEAVYKEDVIEMIQKNKKLGLLGIDKKIKPVCNSLDSYYFMTPGDTNKLIKKNPNIFNVNKIDLEIYATILSCFAIKIKGQIINLLEYIIKQQSELLNHDVEEIYQRLCYIKDISKSHLVTLEDISNLQNVKFIYGQKEILNQELKQKYPLPSYTGENIAVYKEKVMEKLQ